MAERVLLLVGVGPTSDLPLAVRERADAAVVAARRADVRVVEAALSTNGDATGPGVSLPADGRIDDRTLAAIAGAGATSVAVAGAPTPELVAGLAGRLQSVGAQLLVLRDACVIGPPRGPAPPQAPGPAPQAGGTEVTTEAWTSSLAGRPRLPRRRVVSLVSFTVIIALIVALVVWSNQEAKGYFTLSPGSAPLLTVDKACQARSGNTDLTLPGGQPCARVDVPADRAHPANGSLFMVDVLEGRTTWSDWLLHQLGLLHTFRDGSVLLPASEILGGAPADQLNCQNDQEMVQAQTDAPVAALQRLGYDVHQQNFGAQVDLVFPNYPAAAAGVACNDLITSVDGHSAMTVQDVTELLAGKAPGTAVTLGVTSADPKSSRTVQVKLASTPAEGTTPAQPDKGFLGVELETRTTYQLPFGVNVQVGDIGGPSAGLALTLAIINALSNGKLTGGHKVAATGTIAPDGTVGDVGGVAQKAVAVRRAGATLFLVPPEELAAARSEAGSKMKVVPVTSLSQALAALQAIGGQIPPPGRSPAATATPSS